LGSLDLDHVGAEGAEDLRAVRPGDRRRHVQHLHPLERSRFHPCIIAVCVSARMRVVFSQMVDWISGSNWSYVAIFAVAALDAFFPLVPSESMVVVAGGARWPGKHTP